jgi:hypothetical protein
MIMTTIQSESEREIESKPPCETRYQVKYHCRQQVLGYTCTNSSSPLARLGVVLESVGRTALPRFLAVAKLS